jgi:hypothetical protein
MLFRGSRTPLPSARARLIALFCFAPLLSSPLLGQELPSGLEQGLFEIRIGNVAGATELILTNSRGELLLPLGRVAELAELELATSGEGAVFTLPGLGGETAVLDLRKRQIRNRRGPSSLGAEDFVVHDGVTYLSTERLGDLLEAQIQVEWSSLVVLIARTPPFPVEQRVRAEARRAALQQRSTTPVGSVPVVPYPSRTGGAVLQWSVFTSATDPLSNLSLRNQAGAALFGGDLTLSGVLTGSGPSEGFHGLTASYRRTFPGWRVVREIQVGDVFTGGRTVRPIRGFTLSNARSSPDFFFSEVLVRPEIPTGWAFEVYQGNQLLGFSDPSERNPVLVPLRYGQTPVQVRMVSPAGEEVVSNLIYYKPQSQLRPGRFEYSGGLGACPKGVCDGLGYVDARLGASHWLTLGGGVEVERDSTEFSFRPYGSASLATLSGWTAEMHAAPSSFTRASVAYGGLGPVSGSLSGGTTHPGAGVPSFLLTTEPRWHLESGVAIRLSESPTSARSLGLRGRTEGNVGGGLDRWRASTTLDVRRTSIGAEYESGGVFEGAGSQLNLTLLTVTPTWGPGWLQERVLTTGLTLAGEGVRSADLGTSISLGSALQLGVSGHWRARGAPSFTLNLTQVSRAARTQAILFASERRVSGGITADGTLTYDGKGRIIPSSRGGIGGAGITGLVFYDHDGDGRFGPGDEPAADVGIVAGGTRARSDDRGVYHAWNVVPYEVVEIAVDTLQGLDPSWIPLLPSNLLRLPPNMFTSVRIPLVRTRELSGRLVAAPGVRTVGGVTVQLRNVATGKTQSVMTFGDGEFYVSRLRPGDYELHVAESSLRALQAKAESGMTRFTVSGRGEDILVELPPLRLVPDGDQLAAPPGGVPPPGGEDPLPPPRGAPRSTTRGMKMQDGGP